MVLRRFHSAARPGSSFVVSESVCAAHFPALPAHVAMVTLPPHHGVLGVSGLQDASSSQRGHHVERGNG